MSVTVILLKTKNEKLKEHKYSANILSFQE